MLIPSRLKDIVKMAAVESTRYAIDGVCLSRNGVKCRVRVTDGMRLFDCSWKDKEEHKDMPADFQVVIPAHLWKTALSTKRKSVTLKEQFIHSDKPVLVFDRGDCEISGEPIPDAKFPKTDDVIPKYTAKDGLLWGLNVRKLAEVASVFGAIDLEGGRCPSFQIGAANKPLLVSWSDDELTAIGVIMPVNLGSAVL